MELIIIPAEYRCLRYIFIGKRFVRIYFVVFESTGHGHQKVVLKVNLFKFLTEYVIMNHITYNKIATINIISRPDA